MTAPDPTPAPPPTPPKIQLLLELDPATSLVNLQALQGVIDDGAIMGAFTMGLLKAHIVRYTLAKVSEALAAEKKKAKLVDAQGQPILGGIKI